MTLTKDKEKEIPYKLDNITKVFFISGRSFKYCLVTMLQLRTFFDRIRLLTTFGIRILPVFFKFMLRITKKHAKFKKNQSKFHKSAKNGKMSWSSFIVLFFILLLHFCGLCKYRTIGLDPHHYLVHTLKKNKKFIRKLTPDHAAPSQISFRQGPSCISNGVRLRLRWQGDRTRPEGLSAALPDGSIDLFSPEHAVVESHSGRLVHQLQHI